MGLIAWLLDEEPGIFDRIKHNKSAGELCEYMVSYALKSVKGHEKHMNNVYLPYRGRTSEVDVLMIHEKGIFVFECKDYSGWIFGDEDSRYWTQVLNKATKNKFYNPIMQNATHIKALRQFLQLPEEFPMESYIVFSQASEFKKVPKKLKAEHIEICHRERMLKLLRKELKDRPNILTPEQVAAYAATLEPLTLINQGEAVKEQHVETIKQRFKPEKSTPELATSEPNAESVSKE